MREQQSGRLTTVTGLQEARARSTTIKIFHHATEAMALQVLYVSHRFKVCDEHLLKMMID
jgi:hypothetical protein